MSSPRQAIRPPQIDKAWLLLRGAAVAACAAGFAQFGLALTHPEPVTVTISLAACIAAAACWHLANVLWASQRVAQAGGLPVGLDVQDLVDCATDRFAIIDDAGRTLWASDSFMSLLGVSPAFVAGRSPIDSLLNTKTDPDSKQRFLDAIRSRTAFSGEFNVVAGSGKSLLLELSLCPRWDSGRNFARFVLVVGDVTERHRERDRFGLIFASAAEGIVVQARDGTITECNSAAERILGLTADQMKGRTSIDPRWGAIQDDGTPLPGSEHPAMVTLRTGEPIRSFVFGVQTPAGKRRWLSVSTVPIRGEDGELTSVVATFADVSVQREQAKRLDSIIEGAGLGTWDWVVPTGEATFNARWQSMLGYIPGELAANVSSLDTLVHPEDKPRLMKLLTGHLQGESVEYRSELRLRRKDGSWAWVLTSGRVIERNSDGQPVRMVGVHVDISEAKLIEEQLREAKATADVAIRETSALRAALDEHSLLSIADRRGRIIDVNTGFCRISGYNAEQLIGQDHRILNSGVHGREFWTGMWRQIASGQAWRGEICNRRSDGTQYWVDSTIVPCLGADGKIEKYVSIRFDITARKHAEEALIAARAEAQAASAAKSEFIANMSHEIRTPMTAILGFADLLAATGAREATPDQRSDYINTIRRNGEHLLSIINDILDISKIEAGKMTVERLDTEPVVIVRDIMLLLNGRAKGKGIGLSMVLNTPVPLCVRTDPVRFRQIIVNLVGNAIKFTEIGSVTVGMSYDPARGVMSLRIADTGIGMNEVQLKGLFEAFVQADASTTRRFGGTGLGLRISKSLAQMLGGDIAVESTQGRGSAFTLTIPVGFAVQRHLISAVPEPVAVIATSLESPTPEKAPLAGLRIYFAEDGPDNQRLISFHLRKAGAHVTIFENGRLLLEALTVDGEANRELRPQPSCDLVLTDMQMPEMDGYTLAALLRAKGWNRGIVALTAHAMSDDAEKCIQAGCSGYASKPIDPPALIDICVRAAHAVVPGNS